MAIAIGIPLGVLSAVRRATMWDYVGRTFALIGQALPPFWLGLILILVFAVTFNWLPAGTREGPNSLVMPALTLALINASSNLRITRSAMLEVLREDYIRTARAKGLRERIVFFVHVLRPSSIPIVTVVGATVGALATGFVLTETIFAIPGLGQMLVQAITRRDFPIIQALLMVIAVT